MAALASTLWLALSCAFGLAQGDGRFKVWLPLDRGTAEPQPEGEIRVALLWANGTTVRKIGAKLVANDDELKTLLEEAHAELRKEKRPAPLVIDADRRVPWSEVTRLLEAARQSGIDKIEFALAANPAPAPAKDPDPRQPPESRKSEAAARAGPASKGSKGNEKPDDPDSSTVRVVHRDIGGSVACESFRKQLACNDESHWLLQTGGKEHTWDALKARLLEEARLDPEPQRRPGQDARLSNRRVTIRSDPLAPYGLVQRVIGVCAAVGLYKVEVAPLGAPAPK